MKKLFSLLVALVLVFSYTPVSAAEGDIVDIAAGNEAFSILVAALTEADLVGALQGDGPFTVFAPTDQAFADLLEALDISAADLLAHPDLSKVLLYHVVSGKVMSTDLSDGLMAPTLNGESITVDLSDGVKIDSSSVTTADIEATNGVIHIIDTVLVPTNFTLDITMEDDMMEDQPDIVDIALSDESFSMLVMLLQEADLVGALQGDGPFTVFAPTNDAFESLVSALGITPAQLMAQPELANVLLYHVVSGKVLSTDLSDGLQAPTLYGEEITFNLSDGVKANSSSVIAADVLASNGVVHVIDQVLVPSGFVLQDVEIPEEDIPKTGDVSVLPLVAFGLTTFAGVAMTKKRFTK
jgi:transforming growth factor-beta-induced protein